MAVAYAFTKDQMAVDQSLGYPRAYAKLCKDTSLSPYSHGPPFTFTPFALQPQEASRAKELDGMFPILDPQAKPTAKPRIYVSLLWKQLNHLGNAGFDPAMFRVDHYGNVLYFHADSASPLAWDIDHWFPCSRGGLTVPSNLRILQWQVCKRKHNQLEFLVPWWDFQLGISINQFLSFFAASNSDFRHRAFRMLFSGGESEELNDLQTVDSHNFPHPFMELKDQMGLAPAGIVRNRSESCDASTLRSLDIKQSRPNTPIIAAARKLKNGGLKENQVPDMVTNPYQAIVMARDSLKQREETKKMKAEIQRLDDEVNDLRLKNEEEKLTIQELELALIKRRRRAEKCRRLAEAQSSHRAMIEKMIRNAMHQSVVYKEQVRLNQAATNALMARLEAQMAICKSAEKDLHKRFKQRDDLEKQIRPQWEQARKRSRTDDDDALCEEEKDDRTSLIHLPRINNKSHLHKELRVFLEEEHKLSEEALSLIGERKGEEDDEPLKLTLGQDTIEEEDDVIDIAKDSNIKFPFAREPEMEENEESRKERGKGNVEKWLQMLLEEGNEGETVEDETSKTNVKVLNEKYPQQKEIKVLKLSSSDHDAKQKKMEIVEMEGRKPRSMSTPRRYVPSEGDIDVVGKGREARKSFGGGKEKELVRCESARSFRAIPSSPSMIFNMRKGVDCIRKKPLVIDDDDDLDHDEYGNENQPVGNKFLRSPIIKSIIKKAVKM